MNLPDDDPVSVKYMIDYMYGQEYQVLSETSGPRIKIRVNWNSKHKWGNTAEKAETKNAIAWYLGIMSETDAKMIRDIIALSRPDLCVSVYVCSRRRAFY